MHREFRPAGGDFLIQTSPHPWLSARVMRIVYPDGRAEEKGHTTTQFEFEAVMKGEWGYVREW